MPNKTVQRTRQACLAIVSDDETLLFADGFDDAILGIAEVNGFPTVVYDTAKAIAVLRKRDGMTRSDVEEFFSYNVACLLYTSPSPRDGLLSRMPSSA